MGHRSFLYTAVIMALLAQTAVAYADVVIQCPGDADNDAVPDSVVNGAPNPAYDPGVKCKHLTAGDGFVTMADGRPLYTFGFSDVTGVNAVSVMNTGMLGANFSAPTIFVDENDRFYLTLTNVGMSMRPDLFDAHSVHWHGFAQAASVFDGVPEASLTVNMGASLTYFYKALDPGTYMYHCHVEATEHMQMGMLGNFYVRPAQNKLPAGTNLNGFTHRSGNKYVYNDNDGTTYYDVEYPLQISSFDSAFHEASLGVQPLPFALMQDDYGMLNGRGYPDTVNPGELPPTEGGNGSPSQKISSLVTAKQGQKVLLRISNLSVTRFFTVATTGLSMKVVGKDARQLRSPSGENLYYDTNALTLGGGESADVIINTAGAAPGTYFLYTTNMQFLGNNDEDFGGIMTEIVVNPA